MYITRLMTVPEPSSGWTVGLQPGPGGDVGAGTRGPGCRPVARCELPHGYATHTLQKL